MRRGERVYREKDGEGIYREGWRGYIKRRTERVYIKKGGEGIYREPGEEGI